MVTITEIAFGMWDERASLEYIPPNSPLKGKFYGAFGDTDFTLTRRPYKIEEASGVSYVMYDDDKNGGAVIYRLTEV